MAWNEMMRRRRERENALWRLRRGHPELESREREPAEAPVAREPPRLRRWHVALLLLIGLSILVEAIPSPDKSERTGNGSPPYSFDTPPSWEQTPDSEMPPTTLDDASAIEHGDDGILIGSFRPVARERVFDSMREQWTSAGAEVVDQRSLQVAGNDAVQFDVGKPGIRDRTTVVFASAFVAYWIKCISRDDHRETRRACRHVLRTFRTQPRRT
jgi:hypothetical protein